MPPAHGWPLRTQAPHDTDLQVPARVPTPPPSWGVSASPPQALPDFLHPLPSSLSSPRRPTRPAPRRSSPKTPPTPAGQKCVPGLPHKLLIFRVQLGVPRCIPSWLSRLISVLGRWDGGGGQQTRGDSAEGLQIPPAPPAPASRPRSYPTRRPRSRHGLQVTDDGRAILKGVPSVRVRSVPGQGTWEGTDGGTRSPCLPLLVFLSHSLEGESGQNRVLQKQVLKP